MPAAARPQDAVPPTVRGLSLVSLLNDFASEMVYPLLPAFVTRVLGGGALALGALDGAADLTAAVLRWVSGRLADRPRWRDPLILGGYGLATVIRPFMAAASAAWQVVGLRVVDRIGKGLRTPARDAMIAQVTPSASRGRAYGFHRAADHLGAVAGSLAAWALLAGGVGVRQVLLASVVPGLVALVVLGRVLRRAGPASSHASGPAALVAGGPVDAAGWRYWFPLVALTLLTVGRLPETLLLLRLQDLGVGVALIPLVWAVLHVVRSVVSYPGGWLADRVGGVVMVAAGGLGFAAIALLLARPLGAGPAVAVFLGLGVMTGLTEAAERAVVAGLAPRRTGRAFGAAQGMAGLAALPAALAFGGVYQRLGGPLALAASAAVMSGAVVVWMVAGRRGGAAAA